ncbi:hydroxyacylglutathione hydrolase [Thioflavicoccus mobilis 8321]|uniref:Hydroxyacylglutathione hydrolase n=1 Tax=Thioflavicoccus mobilis 8321 TaxID=765912 RepID=L0GUD8_9GAMM|nr:hydroxyacylglutathione hydrolase [Thioflavicoccus mobilis]AGA89601.1 hydroxyacylglutathione hydrolase [Thioflavicoccus mobilis 8321]
MHTPSDPRLEIAPIPALDDNYIWLLHEGDRRQAAVVDPGEAEPVLAALAARGLDLAAILITHHHGDHTAGIADLVAAYPDTLVCGPSDRRLTCLTRIVAEGDEVAVPGLETRFRVLEVPGHTASHIAYVDARPNRPPGDGILFCGDTLFTAGCGRVFDGTCEQLANSLARLAALAPTTLCYCAHEYTLANLGFAAWVEPDNAARQVRQTEAQRHRAAGEPTVPAPLALELATNPFLRTGEPAVIAAAERFAGRPLETHSEVFTALRRWKDTQYD